MDKHGPKMTEENPDDTKSKITEEKAKDTDNRTTQDGIGHTEEFSSANPGPSGSSKKRKLSDSDNTNAKKVAEEIKVKEETYFMDLCTNAARILLNISDDDSQHEALVRIIKSFCYSDGNSYKDIDFTVPENRIGYFTRHGPVSAGVARFKISKILNENENIRNALQSFTSPIKILDLGTGHGCGIMGLCSSLNKYFVKRSIHLTLVDHVKEWVPVFNAVVSSLRGNTFGDASDFFQNNTISTNYLVFDLSRNAKEHEVYKRSLSEANVIIISRVFSITTKQKCLAIARNVVAGMKIGALLFFIDAMGRYPRYYFKNLKKIASEEEDDYEFEGTFKNNFDVSKTSIAKCFVYRKM